MAIAWVVVAHFGDDILHLTPSLKGLVSVSASVHYRLDLLFILSGFLISYAYISPRRGFTFQAYGHMLRARFSRIYPSYLVVTILTMLAVVVGTRLGKGMEGGYPFNAIPVRLLLMQTWPYFTWAITPWTGPLWFLSAIAFAYVFAFPCAWLLIRRLRSTWAILFWVFVPLAVGFASARIPSLHQFCIVLRACGGFISGSALFALYFNGSPVILAAQKHLDKTAALFLAASVFLPMWPSSVDQQFVSLLLLLAGPVITAGLTGESSFTVRLLSTRPLAWLASISYAMYMTHYFAECLLHIVLPTGRFASSPFLLRGLVAAVYFLVVLVSAIALHRLVEVPCAKALKGFSFTRWSNVFNKGGACSGPRAGRLDHKTRLLTPVPSHHLKQPRSRLDVRPGCKPTLLS